MGDIETLADVERLVTEFYGKVRSDDLLAPIFAHVDWEHHTPVIVSFWSSLLLGDNRYRGNPFQKHIRLPIDTSHFQQWLKLFHQTVNELFVGPKADEARDRAVNIAVLFQHRLGLIS